MESNLSITYVGFPIPYKSLALYFGGECHQRASQTRNANGIQWQHFIQVMSLRRKACTRRSSRCWVNSSKVIEPFASKSASWNTAAASCHGRKMGLLLMNAKTWNNMEQLEPSGTPSQTPSQVLAELGFLVDVILNYEVTVICCHFHGIFDKPSASLYAGAWVQKKVATLKWSSYKPQISVWWHCGYNIKNGHGH